jgi:hypothetical protein
VECIVARANLDHLDTIRLHLLHGVTTEIESDLPPPSEWRHS